MKVWRICKARWAAAAFDGEGARLAGGRWNHRGLRVVYTSESLALAALEVLVHANPSSLPNDLVACSAAIPADVFRRQVVASELPHGWNGMPVPETTKELGSVWIRSGESVALIVPSAIVPIEHTILLNPSHLEFGRVEIHEPIPFAFDDRIEHLARGRP